MNSLVYIAGPLTRGEYGQNVRNAIAAADAILACGYTPLVPHLTHFWDLMSPKSYETWLQYDLRIIPQCCCLVRLDGDSPGADREVALAQELRVPVWTLEGFLRAHPRE